MELPNLPGQSHRFDEIEPHCRAATQEVMIGSCRVRRIPIREVLAITERLILANPAALLCDAPECRCFAALQQRLETLSRESKKQVDCPELPSSRDASFASEK
jgi:aminoglycoside 3-N-acetyltransferase